MSLLSEINTLLLPLVPVETGVFSKPPLNSYAVITPLADTFALFADDIPQQELQEARISIFTKGSYTALKNQIIRALLNADFLITDRRYLGHEDDTGYHHYAIDCGKCYGITPNYELEDE